MFPIGVVQRCGNVSTVSLLGLLTRCGPTTGGRFAGSLAAQSTLNNRYRVVVVGGGAGGCSVAAKLARQLGRGQVAVIEPAETHYYQPMWTLVAAGAKRLQDSARHMAQVLPRKVDWIQDRAVQFKPDENVVLTSGGRDVHYDFLVIATGIQMNWDEVRGLPGALDTPGVCSIYSVKYVPKTYRCLQEFREGNAIFTFPNTPIKCPGAPQKIMYLAEAFFRKTGKRGKAVVKYNSAFHVLFPVELYCDALWRLVEQRDIQVNLHTNLTEIRPDTREAVFENLQRPGETHVEKYEMIHVAPPMSAPDVIRFSAELSDAAGFLAVNEATLQHVRYRNVFGIGDCLGVPTARTAAAVAAECNVVASNLMAAMSGGQLASSYDGYTSCPLLTDYNKAMMIEFHYGFQPLPTFPIDQTKERRSMFWLKNVVIPSIYWNLMLKGRWNGPGALRRLLHPFSGR